MFVFVSGFRGAHSLGAYSRQRSVIHCGDNPEMLGFLGSHGIPPGSVPTQLGGTFASQDFLAWMKSQSALEQTRAHPQEQAPLMPRR